MEAITEYPSSSPLQHRFNCEKWHADISEKQCLINQVMNINNSRHLCNNCSEGMELRAKWPDWYSCLLEDKTKIRWTNHKKNKEFELTPAHKTISIAPVVPITSIAPIEAITITPFTSIEYNPPPKKEKNISEKTRLKKIAKIKADKTLSASVRKSLLAELGE